ncbi:protein jag [Sporolactobacillus sp. THM7-7]|nr:protein jag [Sporolactobacillus sp. THM7-7]
MREVAKYGKTVADAISLALEELNATPEQVETKVLEEPRRGFLGIGARQALVRVVLKKTAFDFGMDYLKNIVRHMGFSTELKVRDQNERLLHCQFVGKDAAKLIGKHGRTLNALQVLANLVINKHSDYRMTVMIDAENYRAERRQALIALADRMARKVEKKGKPYRLNPMPAFERKIIHSELAGRSEVETYSVGEEPYRCVTITPR